MNVSSVKNLNGETFSAVQDADLTTVVQTNSGNWNDITAYQNVSSTYLTALPNTASIHVLSARDRVRVGDDDSYKSYASIDRNGIYFKNGTDRPYNIGIDSTGSNFYIATAKNGYTRIYASSISGWNDALSSYQTASSTYLTAINIPESAEWEDTTDVVQTNSASWGAGSTPTYDYTDNNLISAIDTSGLYATSAGTSLIAANANRLIASGEMGANVIQAGAGKFYYMPTNSPFVNPQGIYSPLQFATGACLTMVVTGAGYAAYYKGNEWYVSNMGVGQMLRGEVHQSRGTHISGATTAGYSFDLSINAVSGKNDTANNYNWKLERGCVSGKGTNGEWRYGPAEDTALRTASAWNDTIDVVQSNSATWGQGGGSVDSIPFVVNSPLVTGFTGTSAYLGLDSTAIDMSPYVPYSALSVDWDGRVHTINGSAIYSEYANEAQRADNDSNGDYIPSTYQKISDMSNYQTSLTFDGSDNTITAINNSAIGGTMESFELSGGDYISIIDDIVSSATVISVSGISASEWNDTTDVVQTNSSNWSDITAYQTYSGDYLQGVSSDSTISGDGTVNSPLGVVNPLPYPMEIVSTSSEATGTNILYVVTGAGA